MLYRPFEEDHEANLRSNRNMSCLNNGNNSICPVERFQNDDPPKYSPPPSYSTATGAKLAKILRQSFRRSVRRILGESTITRPVLSVPHEFHSEQISYPINNSIEIVVESTSNVSQSLEFEDRPCVYGRSLSLGRKHIFNKSRFKETVENPLGGQSYNKNSHKLRNRQFTAEDVKSILGSSTLGRRRGPQVVQTEPTFRSIDNLVQNAEPINLSPSINHNQMNVNNEI